MSRERYRKKGLAPAPEGRGRAEAAQQALVDGVPGLVWAPGGQPRVAFAFNVAAGRITAIELISDPDRLREMDLEIDEP